MVKTILKNNLLVVYFLWALKLSAIIFRPTSSHRQIFFQGYILEQKPAIVKKDGEKDTLINHIKPERT
jgi:hypothetical protein